MAGGDEGVFVVHESFDVLNGGFIWDSFWVVSVQKGVENAV